MKKGLFGTLLIMAVGFTAGFGPSGSSPDRVDDAKVNARVDARLHQVLKGLLRSQTEAAQLVR